MYTYRDMAVLPICTGPNRPGCTHPATLALVARRVEPWGHFIVARIAGTRVPHDYRLPLEVPYLPPDAVALPEANVEAYWHGAEGAAYPPEDCRRALQNAALYWGSGDTAERRSALAYAREANRIANR